MCMHFMFLMFDHKMLRAQLLYLQAEIMTMRKTLIVTIVLFVLWGCENQSQKEISAESKSQTEKYSKAEDLENTSEEDGWNYTEVKRHYIDTLMFDVCSTNDMEFIDLYPTLDSIASDKYENLNLVDLLKIKNFEVTNWSRGNWMEGPRIVSFTMSNQLCECQIDKLYYSTEQEGKYNVTERIKCHKANR